MRSIRVKDVRKKATHVDLTLPAGAPIELVDVTAAEFEPDLLVGAPHLTYLALAGNEKPVRIAGLATVPNLLRLDLSGAALADVTTIATFSALRCCRSTAPNGSHCWNRAGTRASWLLHSSRARNRSGGNRLPASDWS